MLFIEKVTQRDRFELQRHFFRQSVTQRPAFMLFALINALGWFRADSGKSLSGEDSNRDFRITGGLHRDILKLYPEVGE